MLNALRAEIASASQASPAAEEVSTVESISEFSVDDSSPDLSLDAIAPAEQAPAAETRASAAGKIPVEPAVAPTSGVLDELVNDIESSLGDSFLPGSAPQVPGLASAKAKASKQQPVDAEPELEPVGNSAPTTFGVSETQPLGEFVADLEASLGDGFLEGAATATAQPAIGKQPAAVSPLSATLAASAAAAAGASSVSMPVPVAPRHPSAPIVPGAPTASKAAPLAGNPGIDLAEMFGELKQDLEAGAGATEEDPETHYNLGIAFREMGLLDEAIGELQKTCQAIDHGHPFPQTMQTYTWLAQCFLDKGVAEAAIRWYEKALNVAGIDEETRTALHYEIGAAYETAGDKTSALKHFMEVYGRNIDYRDVAERIKPLKS